MKNIKQTIISNCQKFRYTLYRKIESVSNENCLIFCMINPSTASVTENDATIRKCIKIAENQNCGHLYVVNLIPYRSPDVKEVETYLKNLNPLQIEKIIIENFNYIDQVLSSFQNSVIICGWGKYDKIEQSENLAKTFYKQYHSYNLKALKINKDQSPIHPLFVNISTQLIDFNPDNLKK